MFERERESERERECVCVCLCVCVRPILQRFLTRELIQSSAKNYVFVEPDLFPQISVFYSRRFFKLSYIVRSPKPIPCWDFLEGLWTFVHNFLKIFLCLLLVFCYCCLVLFGFSVIIVVLFGGGLFTFFYGFFFSSFHISCSTLMPVPGHLFQRLTIFLPYYWGNPTNIQFDPTAKDMGLIKVFRHATNGYHSSGLLKQFPFTLQGVMKWKALQSSIAGNNWWRRKG